MPLVPAGPWTCDNCGLECLALGELTQQYTAYCIRCPGCTTKKYLHGSTVTPRELYCRRGGGEWVPARLEVDSGGFQVIWAL
jgi:hypothetical protein